LEIAVGIKQILDFFERLFMIWIGTAWGKGALALILGGVLSITSIFQYLIPPVFKVFTGVTVAIPETPAWVSLTLIILGIVLLVLSRLIPDRNTQIPRPNPHDVRLLADYRALITPRVTAFLNEHSFRLPFRVERTNALETLAHEWRGAHYEFLNAEMQQALEQTIAAARALCNLLDAHIFLDYNNPEIGSPLTDEDKRVGIQPGTRDAIAKMNAHAKAFVAAANNFERLARKTIPA